MKDTEKETLIHSKLNKEVDLFKIQFFSNTFITDNKFNAKGRFYLDFALICLFIITFQVDAPFIRGAYFGLLSFIFPLILTATTKYVMKEFKPSQDNLYDFLLVFGSYGIVVILTLLASWKICKLIYTHVALPPALLMVISIAGLIGAVLNYILMKAKKLY